MRTLGTSGVPVSRLGLGTAPLGNLWRAIDDHEALDVVDAAWEAGIRYLDTAPHYGLGLAERRLGAALQGRPRDEVTVSTKVGRRLDPLTAGPDALDLEHGFHAPVGHRRVWDFSADGVRRTLESSLDRLGLDRVDVVMLHDAGLADPTDHLDQAIDEAFPALAELRSQGVVGAVGAGMGQPREMARLIRATDLDMVMLAGRLTLLDRSGAEEVLPLCAERGIGFVAAAPFNSGLLARPEPARDGTYDYAVAPAELVDRARRIARVCEDHGVALPQAALHYPLTYPDVTSLVVGLQTRVEVELAAGRLARPVPDALWADLRAQGLLADVAG